MTKTNSVNDKTWAVEEVLTMACAIHRLEGFTSSSSITFSDTNKRTWTSKEHLSYQLVPEIAGEEYKVLINVTQDDVDNAQAIIHYYRRLTFGVIADNLGDYMQRVFANTQTPEVRFKDFAVVASVPNTYYKEMEKKKLEKEVRSTRQDHLGTVGETMTIDVRYIGVRFIPKLTCFGHDAITSTGYLVNFLSKQKLAEVGATQKIRAKIKAHGVNFITKTKETQLNYVKVVDTEFVWQ